MAEAEKKDEFTLKGCGLFVLVMFGLSAVTLFACMSIGSGSADRAPSDVEARNVCQDWVRDRLKAPATAEFSETTVDGGPAEWSISGVVDAENGFGAQVRSAWTCDVRLDDETWRGSARLIE